MAETDQYPALSTAGEARCRRPPLMLSTTSQGKVFLDLGHVNRRELLKLCLSYVENLRTR